MHLFCFVFLFYFTIIINYDSREFIGIFCVFVRLKKGTHCFDFPGGNVTDPWKHRNVRISGRNYSTPLKTLLNNPTFMANMHFFCFKSLQVV